MDHNKMFNLICIYFCRYFWPGNLFHLKRIIVIKTDQTVMLLFSFLCLEDYFWFGWRHLWSLFNTCNHTNLKIDITIAIKRQKNIYINVIIFGTHWGCLRPVWGVGAPAPPSGSSGPQICSCVRLLRPESCRGKHEWVSSRNPTQRESRERNRPCLADAHECHNYHTLHAVAEGGLTCT